MWKRLKPEFYKIDFNPHILFVFIKLEAIRCYCIGSFLDYFNSFCQLGSYMEHNNFWNEPFMVVKRHFQNATCLLAFTVASSLKVFTM